MSLPNLDKLAVEGMHAITHLSPKYQAMRTPENGWFIEEAGMAQLDDIVAR